LNRRAATPTGAGAAIDTDLLAQTVNQLNNHLSAVIGNAELAFTRTNLSGETEEHLRSIIAEAEEAARYLKESLGRMEAGELAGSVTVPREKSLGDTVESILRRLRVAEGLYMAGGRAREINLHLQDDAPVPVAEERLLGLVEETLNRFGSAAADDDVLSIGLYRREDSLYLDISRHRKNFPAVEQVAGFGNYNWPEKILAERPADTFLRYLAGSGAAYAHDRMTQPPSYLSFRFPIETAPVARLAERTEEPVRILAIDDQTVILDLISAMSQSLGYEVHTASSGSEGIALARKHRYSIVLTDLAMPGMSGLDAAAEIRKYQPDTPIVLVTGWEVRTDPDRLASAGIVDVLYKPFRIEQLTDVIRKAVAARTI
jgi:CheY-like chemotaxis protein